MATGSNPARAIARPLPRSAQRDNHGAGRVLTRGEQLGYAEAAERISDRIKSSHPEASGCLGLLGDLHREHGTFYPTFNVPSEDHPVRFARSGIVGYGSPSQLCVEA